MASDPTRNLVPQRHFPQQSQQAVLMERCWLLFWICLLRMGAALTPRRTGVTPFFLPTCVYDGHLSPGSLVRRHPQRPGVVAAGASAGMMTLPNPLGGVFVLLAYTYDAPGKAPKGNEVSSCHQALTKPQEGVIGLYYDGYRWTKVGVWLSADPIKEDGGLNLYAYVGNDPVNMIDPLGLEYEYGLNDAVTVVLSPQLYVLARSEIWAPSDGLTNFAAGGADIASGGLSNLARGGMGANEYVGKDTGAYTAGQWTGGALLVANITSSLFNAGANSALWTGVGGAGPAEAVAAQASARGLTTVGMTMGGRFLIGPNTPRWLVTLYSGIFAANARGGITVFTCTGEAGSTYLLERAIMRILNNAFIGRGVFF